MTNDEIRRVTMAATPGPWRVEYDWGAYDGDPGDDVGWVHPHGAYSQRQEDNEFIATWNPSRALAALDVIEAAEELRRGIFKFGYSPGMTKPLVAALRAWMEI